MSNQDPERYGMTRVFWAEVYAGSQCRFREALKHPDPPAWRPPVDGAAMGWAFALPVVLADRATSATVPSASEASGKRASRCE